MLAVLSDEFEDALSLPMWHRFDFIGGWPNRLLHIDIGQSLSGSLYMKPATSTWFDDFQGPLLYKRVGGDFVATCRIKTRGVLSDSSSRPFSLAGIMARKSRHVTPQTWVGGGENWVFLTYGFGSAPPIPNFETKTTINSQSTLNLFPADTGWVEIRLAREGASFQMSRRYPGQNWVELSMYERADMDLDTLDVGIVCYTDWPTVSAYDGNPLEFNTLEDGGGVPDLQVWIDYIRFSRP
jgi:hypothetical protein